MKYLLPKILLIAYFVFFAPATVLAEEISSFRADITINQTGTMDVVETIQYDFGAEDRHGIYRMIPLVKTNAEGKRFRLKIEPQAVTDENGNTYRVSKSIENRQQKFKIGDPDKTITGEHTYVIPYTVSGAITYFSDHDELYWNVTGTDWKVPIKNVVVTVKLPSSLSSSDVRLACYTGVLGSTEQACSHSYADGVAIFQLQDMYVAVRGRVGQPTYPDSLAAGENLTIVVGFPKGIVEVLEPVPVVSFWDTIWGKLTLVVLAILAVLWYIVLPFKIILDWFKRGRDPRAPMGVTSAWFSAAKTAKGVELTPAETGTLVDERADMADIVATIVDLARRGYLTIKEVKKGEFTLEKIRGFVADSSLLGFEQTLLSGLFATGNSFTPKQASLVTTIADVQKQLYEAVVAHGFFEGNPHSVRQRYTMLGIAGLVTGNLPLLFVSFVFGHAMPRKTAGGSQANAISRSLKNFLTSQKRYLTWQADKQLLFEKLLPFAVAFGVEELWARRFRDINIKQPEWFEAASGSRFSSAYFTRSLHSSFASSMSRAATPTSSSRGFSSGFSGGSSGGGGGGGGGGSW